MNEGKLNGLVKEAELRSQLAKLSARVDAIISAIQNSAVAAADGGATFKANMIGYLEAITSKEDFSNIANTKLKH